MDSGNFAQQGYLPSFTMTARGGSMSEKNSSSTRRGIFLLRDYFCTFHPAARRWERFSAVGGKNHRRRGRSDRGRFRPKDYFLSFVPTGAGGCFYRRFFSVRRPKICKGYAVSAKAEAKISLSKNDKNSILLRLAPLTSEYTKPLFLPDKKQGLLFG